jgi:hypothetical protein
MIILKHDPVLGLETYVTKQIKTNQIRKDDAVLIPKIKSNIYVRYADWVTNYKIMLLPHIDDLWHSLYNIGIVVDYNGFCTDVLKCMYKKSSSRFSNFTFLGT